MSAASCPLLAKRCENWGHPVRLQGLVPSIAQDRWWRKYFLQFFFGVVAEFLSSAERRRVSVTPEERERMAILCGRIAKEQDPREFTKLVDELNELLAKETRVENEGLPANALYKPKAS